MIQRAVVTIVVGLLVGYIFKVQASNESCCICKRKFNKYSDQKIFLSSANYEQDFVEAFGVNPHDRHGLICRVCVAALQKWRKHKLQKSIKKVSSI